MSFAKGFVTSFILSFLAFAVIILYGGSFALSLVKEDDSVIEEDIQDGTTGENSQSGTVYTTHETFSFALVITDEIPVSEDEEDSEGEEGEDPEENEDGIGPTTREITGGESSGENTGSGVPGTTPNPDGTQNPDGSGSTGDGDSETPELPEEPIEPEIPEYITEFDEILSQYGKGPEEEIKFICVVSINSTVKKTLITVIPGDTMIPIGDVDLSLTYVNYLSSIPELKLNDLIPSTVTATTGIIPDFYGYVDIDDFVTLADELGGIPYMLPAEITTVKKSDGEEIVIPAGDLTLDSEMLSALLEYDLYGYRYMPSQILIEVAKGMMDGICSKFKPNIIAKVRDMLRFVETDFTTDDMLRVSGIFFSYESSEKSCVALLGAYERFGDEILFRPNYLGSVDKFKQYLN